MARLSTSLSSRVSSAAMVFASADREGEGEKEKSNRNCSGVSYQTSQQFEFVLVGAGHLDSNHGESRPNFRGDALGGDQGCIVCHMMLSHQPSEFW